MDPTEDLSARVLLKHILSTETPRTPITRSVSQGSSTSGTRRSNRPSKKDAGAQTPQDIIRRSMRQKMRESITRKSLPHMKRRTASVVLRKTDTPAAASMLLNDEDTPRHILMNILRTEPVKSPVVHEKGPSEEPVNDTVNRTHSSIELSGLELPDLTIGHAASTAKGLSRKRPRRSLNVTAFEKRLKAGDGAEEEIEDSTGEHSSLSLSSSTSLSLKTPFVDVRTEKRGLQRKVSNRRKITVEEFGAAVNTPQMEGVSSFAEQDLSEKVHSETFTLGLSKLEPDITTDIIHCNTALYAQPNTTTSNLSIVATQDKPTVMASQLQRQMEQEEQMETEQSKLGKDKSLYVFASEEDAVAEPQNDEFVSEFQSQEDEDGCQMEEGKQSAHGQPEDAAVMLKSEEEEDVAESQASVTGDTAESEEGANAEEAQTEEESAVDSQPEEIVEESSQSEEGAVAPDSQTEEEEEEGTAESQTEEEEEGAAESQTEEEEEEGAAESQTDEEGAVDFQPEETVEESSQSEEGAVAPDAQTEEEEEEEEEGAPESQTDEEGAVDFQPEETVEESSQSEEGDIVPDSQPEEEEEEEEGAAESQTEEDEDVAESQNEDDCDGKRGQEEEEQAAEQLEHDLEHISRRAHRSEGAFIMPVTEAGEDLADATAAGWSDAKSKAHSALDLHSSLEMGSQESSQSYSGKPELAESPTEGEPDAGKESSVHLLGVTQDTEHSGHLSDAPPEEAAPQDAVEQEEEEEEEDDDEEESEEFSSKTPAFVKEKRNFCLPEPPASPSVFRNIQASGTSEALPAAKPKQVRQRKTRPAKKKSVLPKSYLMGVFRHFAKTKVSSDVYPVLDEIMDKFFDRLADDLETYALHAKRKTIEVEDAELLLKRQGYVNDKVPVQVLIEKYLRMDQRKLLIPIATSGNVVIPNKRR